MAKDLDANPLIITHKNQQSHIYICSFIAERAFPLEIKGSGINVSCFFLYVEVINRSVLLVPISTPRNGNLLLMLISWAKLRTELLLKSPRCTNRHK